SALSALTATAPSPFDFPNVLLAQHQCSVLEPAHRRCKSRRIHFPRPSHSLGVLLDLLFQNDAILAGFFSSRLFHSLFLSVDTLSQMPSMLLARERLEAKGIEPRVQRLEPVLASRLERSRGRVQEVRFTKKALKGE